jgi:hypothetical protein
MGKLARIKQRLFQLEAGSMQMNFGCIVRTAEDLCGFGICQPVHVAQENCQTVCLRELVYKLLDASAHFAPINEGFNPRLILVRRAAIYQPINLRIQER